MSTDAPVELFTIVELFPEAQSDRTFTDDADNVLLFADQQSAEAYMRENDLPTYAEVRDRHMAELTEQYKRELRKYRKHIRDSEELRSVGLSRLITEMRAPSEPGISPWWTPPCHYEIGRAKVIS